MPAIHTRCSCQSLDAVIMYSRRIPALLMSTCTVPKALTAASTTLSPSATDPGAGAAWPPASTISQLCSQIRRIDEVAQLTFLDLVHYRLGSLGRDIVNDDFGASGSEEVGVTKRGQMSSLQNFLMVPRHHHASLRSQDREPASALYSHFADTASSSCH